MPNSGEFVDIRECLRNVRPTCFHYLKFNCFRLYHLGLLLFLLDHKDTVDQAPEKIIVPQVNSGILLVNSTRALTLVTLGLCSKHKPFWPTTLAPVFMPTMSSMLSQSVLCPPTTAFPLRLGIRQEHLSHNSYSTLYCTANIIMQEEERKT